MQMARCHLGVIYPNLGVIWTWVCAMHLATDAQYHKMFYDEFVVIPVYSNDSDVITDDAL